MNRLTLTLSLFFTFHFVQASAHYDKLIQTLQPLSLKDLNFRRLSDAEKQTLMPKLLLKYSSIIALIEQTKAEDIPQFSAEINPPPAELKALRELAKIRTILQLKIDQDLKLKSWTQVLKSTQTLLTIANGLVKDGQVNTRTGMYAQAFYQSAYETLRKAAAAGSVNELVQIEKQIQSAQPHLNQLPFAAIQELPASFNLVMSEILKWTGQETNSPLSGVDLKQLQATGNQYFKRLTKAAHNLKFDELNQLMLKFEAQAQNQAHLNYYISRYGDLGAFLNHDFFELTEEKKRETIITHLRNFTKPAEESDADDLSNWAMSLTYHERFFVISGFKRAYQLKDQYALLHLYCVNQRYKIKHGLYPRAEQALITSKLIEQLPTFGPRNYQYKKGQRPQMILEPIALFGLDFDQITLDLVN